jgi:hypothetical protein
MLMRQREPSTRIKSARSHKKWQLCQARRGLSIANQALFRKVPQFDSLRGEISSHEANGVQRASEEGCHAYLHSPEYKPKAYFKRKLCV